MNSPSPTQPRKTRHPLFWILLVLLTAAFLRLVLLEAVPPGLTHDEADHGLDAWGVVNGVRPLYFSVGYGREPFFDYATALLMAGSGPYAITVRLTAAFSSLILLAAVYAFTQRAFNRRVALLTTAALAVSFWGVMSGRQALRSITLPALFTLAVAVYWAWRQRPTPGRLLAATLLLGATFYTYVPARALWLIFPTLLLYGRLIGRPRHERGTLLMVAGAGALALPLLLTVAGSGVETRLGQLDAPLRAAAAGDFGPLMGNAIAALQLFTFTGDPTWRYNLPGRPWLTPAVGVLFYAGLLLAVWYAFGARYRRESPAAFLSLAWLLGGLAPVLVTGPELAMTQAIGLLPVLYLFPALALDALYLRLRRGHWLLWHLAPRGAYLLIFFLMMTTIVDYFIRWGGAPEVRLQYETTLVTTVALLKALPPEAAAISTITPDQFHSPAVAFLHAPNDAQRWRWFDGRHAIVLPAAEESWLSFSGLSPSDSIFRGYFGEVTPLHTIAMRENDINRPIELYQVDGTALRDEVAARLQQAATPALPATWLSAGLARASGATGVVTLLGYEVEVAAETVTVVTLWQVEREVDVPLVAFTHLVDAAGVLVAQADRLDAPSLYWQAGDAFMQWHRLALPAGLPPGEYTPVVGLYPAAAPERRLGVAGDGDSVRLAPVVRGR